MSFANEVCSPMPDFGTRRHEIEQPINAKKSVKNQSARVRGIFCLSSSRILADFRSSRTSYLWALAVRFLFASLWS